MDVGALVDLVFVGREDVFVRVEIPHSVVLIAHGHRILRQHEQRAAHIDGIGLDDGTCGHVRQERLDFDVLFKCFYLADSGGI